MYNLAVKKEWALKRPTLVIVNLKTINLLPPQLRYQV